MNRLTLDHTYNDLQPGDLLLSNGYRHAMYFVIYTGFSKSRRCMSVLSLKTAEAILEPGSYWGARFRKDGLVYCSGLENEMLNRWDKPFRTGGRTGGLQYMPVSAELLPAKDQQTLKDFRALIGYKY